MGAAARMSAEDRRHQLVGAAVDVALAEGVEAVTVRRVATEAGVSLGLVHYCFEDKDELLDQMAATILDASAGAASAAVPAGSDVRTALRGALRGLWSTLEATPGHQLLTYELMTHGVRHVSVRDTARAQQSRALAATRSLLVEVARACDAHWTVPVPRLARLVLACVDGAALAWLLDGDSRGALAALDLLAAQVAGLAESSPARARAGPGGRS